MTPSNNHIVITAGYDCNSSCEMCVVGSRFHSTNNSTTEEIFNILSKGIKNNSNSVEISGGEPTVRKDLVLLVLKAKKLGYKSIGISTNGMLLSNKNYCDKLISAGLNYITFSLHAHNKAINEIITNTPNSFEKTVTGIKNATLNKNVEIKVVTAVQKSNFNHLIEIGNLLISLGVNSWNVCDLVPIGMAKEKYSQLCVNRVDLYKSLMNIIPLSNKIQIMLFNFSQCTIPKEFSKENIMTMSRKCEETNFISFDKKGTFKKSTINDGTIKKISICNSCKYSNECSGFWSEYFNLYGEKDIIKLATENEFIK